MKTKAQEWEEFGDMILKNSDDLAQAENSYTEGIKLNPTNVGDLYFKRGMVRYKMKSYMHATLDFNFFTQINPKLEKGWSYYALCMFHLKNYDNAIKYYNNAININNTEHGLFYIRGVSKVMAHKYREALEDFDKAFNLGASNILLYYWTGKCFKEIKEFDKAIFNLSICLNNQNKISKNFNVDSFINRGLSYFNLEKYEEALLDFTYALSLDEYNGNALYNRAICHLIFGNQIEGKNDLFRAKELGNKDAVKFYEKNKNVF